MIKLNRGALVLAVAWCIALPGVVQGHGSPTRWAAESTDYGCWITRWLGRAPEGGGEAMVGLQVVLGRIVPARGDIAQPMLTQPELDGATTLNVRVVDPSLKDAQSIGIERSKHDPIELQKRQLEGEIAEFPSFYLTGPIADSILASLRGGEVTSVSVRKADGSEVSFSVTETGLRVGFPMYDACIANKPAK